MMKTYLLTILCACVIAILSLMPVPELHLENMQLSDKWAHSLMYGGLTAAMLFDLNFTRLKNKLKLSIPPIVCVFPIVYGGVMELLQAYCTNGNRSGDWLDFLANTLGTAFVFVLAVLVKVVFRI